MKKADADLTLENEKLDQYLDAADPAPPVVVVQYRNRGIPSWVVFPLVALITFGALGLYHRFVVERYRVQADESKRVLDKLLEARPSGRPAQVNERAVPIAASPQPGPLAPDQFGKSGPAPAPLLASPAPPDPQTAAVSAPPAATAAVSAVVPLAGSPPSSRDAPAGPSGPGVADPIQAASLPANPPTAQPKENPPLAADSVQPAVPAAASSIGNATTAGPRLRTILPSPFADDDPPTAPLPEVSRDRVGTAPAGGQPATSSDRDLRPADRDAQVALPAPVPLPSKEQNLRDFAEEGARKQEELAARGGQLRALRYEERVKFREELREILRTGGKEAASEIDILSNRYGFDVDRLKYDQAIKIWLARRSPASKVRLIRSLDLPEKLIFDLLYHDLHKGIRSTKGPRDDNEARVRAAQQLLSFELSEADGAPPAGTAAAPRANPAQTVAPRAAGPGTRP